jgi:hypothetical protein
MRRAWPLALRAAACAPRGAPGAPSAAAAAAARRGNAGAAGEGGGEAASSDGGAAAPAAAAAEEEAYVEPSGPVGPPVTPEEAGFPYLLDLTGRGADPAYFRNAHLSGAPRRTHTCAPLARSPKTLGLLLRTRARALRALALPAADRAPGSAAFARAARRAAAAAAHRAPQRCARTPLTPLP